MKDIQGIQRGKCNSCECEEYRAPSAPGVLRCEYCNHTPGEHVRMVELGACTKCGKDNCDKYVSEDPNSYTDCQYCGCGASHHEGAAACKLNSAQPLRCWHTHCIAIVSRSRTLVWERESGYARPTHRIHRFLISQCVGPSNNRQWEEEGAWSL